MITIDGPAGAGKSTVARAVAERLGYRYVDTGLMYRELTAARWSAASTPTTATPWRRWSASPPRRRSTCAARRSRARQRRLPPLPGADADARAAARPGPDAVLEGRDTGTRVCPDADVKVYLTASLEARAARRAADLGLAADDVGRTIAARDRGDAEQLAPARGRPRDRHVGADGLRDGGRDRPAGRGGGVSTPEMAGSATAPGCGFGASSAASSGCCCGRGCAGASTSRGWAVRVRLEPRVVVGHPRPGPGAAAQHPLHGQERALPRPGVRAHRRLGRRLPRPPWRARPRCASDRARDDRGRRRGRDLHPGPSPGRARGGEGGRRPLRRRRGRAGRPRARSAARASGGRADGSTSASGRRGDTSAATAARRRPTGRRPTSSWPRSAPCTSRRDERRARSASGSSPWSGSRTRASRPS